MVSFPGLVDRKYQSYRKIIEGVAIECSENMNMNALVNMYHKLCHEEFEKGNKEVGYRSAKAVSAQITNTISLSFFNASYAYCNEYQNCLTASNTVSLSFCNASDKFRLVHSFNSTGCNSNSTDIIFIHHALLAFKSSSID